MSNNIKKDLDLFHKIAEFFLKEERKKPVAEYIDPLKTREIIDIKLSKKGVPDKELRSILKKLIAKTPKSSSKLFFNQLFGGRHSKAVLGDLLAVILNNSMATYKIAGPQVSLEKEILSQVHKMIGYNNNSGGTFPTGGSMCNFMSLIMARDRIDLQIKQKGIFKKLVAYTSENAHYSLSKNASFSGLGKENIRYIKSDNFGKINVLAFEEQVKKDVKNGFIPFYLNATAGTTVLCAFDDVLLLSTVCKKYNMWLHLDGAFGGSVIFSNKHKHLVDGIHLTDSFCFNAHKTLGAPLSTSVLVVKDKEDLYNSFDNDANYLYQTHDKEFNLGKTSLECGRRNNALKFWVMWKAIGTNGISSIVENEFKLADAARDYIKKNSNYKLYSFEESLSVCFTYKDFDSKDLCAKLYEKNTLMVGYGSFKNTTFIRLVIVNCENSVDDLMRFFTALENFAKKNKNIIKKT